MNPRTLSPEEIGRLAVERRVLTARQLEHCRDLVRAIEEDTGLSFTLGQIILERVYASNPKARPILSRPGGVQEILGPGVEVDFLKIPKAAHDRLLERVERANLVAPERLREGVVLREGLARHGIVKRLGEILILKGYLDRALAEECLRPAPELAKVPAFAFARIAVANGLVSERDASEALELADQVAEELDIPLPIGQVFYELGMLRRREVEAILAAQVDMGRLRPEDARIRTLELTGAEREHLRRRLLGDGHIVEADWSAAAESSRKLASFALEIDPVEVLWLRDRIPEAAIADILEFQEEAFARLDPDTPTLSLSVAPSAECLASQAPPDLAGSDFLFGQFALVAGAASRDELDAAIHAVRRVRHDGGNYSIERALFDRYRSDEARLRLLENVRRDLARFEGRPHRSPQLPLSPIERDIVREMIDLGGPWTEEQVGKATARACVLAELGIEKDVAEILVEEPTASGRPGWEVVPGRDRVEQRLVGGHRRPKTAEFGLERALFAQAFAKGSDWGANHLGSLALEAGLLSQAQLAEALHVQLQARELGLVKPFGEVLVEKGFLAPEALADLLQLQGRRLALFRSESESPEKACDLVPEDERLLLRLRELGVLTDQRLRDALRVRRQLKALGLEGSLQEVLVRRGYLDPELVGGLLLEEDGGVHAESRRLPTARTTPDASSSTARRTASLFGIGVLLAGAGYLIARMLLG